MGKNEGLVNRYLKMINEENKRLAMLVEEVLQSAVLDKGGFKIKPEEVNLEHLVREVVSKMEIKLKEKKGKISITSDPNGRYEFVGDRIHLTNLFYNLVDNAIKYSREQPEISIEIKNTTNQIAIHVTDNGIGISPEHIKKVFDKLYRVPTGNLHDVKGFGLGLNYVKTIVSRHGGTVEVKSDLGKGSTFSVYFPIQERKENSK
jgi:two-component system phosphate regulon sensor histidine kinase PhoR